MTADRHTQQGQAWLLMCIILLLGSATLLLARLDIRHREDRATLSAHALMAAREALLGYALTYRENHPDEGYGYLPCPDLTGTGEASGTCGAQGTYAIGLLPYKTLGMPDLRDGSGECLWYAVAGRFKNNPKSDLLNWDAQGDLAVADANGQFILGGTDDAHGGIAAIIFAPGAPLSDQAAGRTATANPCRANPQQAALYLESTQPPFRQGADTPSGNDQLRWITNADIFSRLRLRKDFASYINNGIRSLQSALSFNQTAHPPTTDARLPASISSALSPRDRQFHAQWRDQFAYLSCTTGKSYCYALGGQQCDGALVFSGEQVNGHPRPNTARKPADYFESSLGLVTGISNSMPFLVSAYAANSLAARSQDIVRCLTPRTQVLASDSPTTQPNPVGTLITQSSAGGALPWLQLGQSNLATLASGCAWFPEPLIFGAGADPMHLRAYFTFTINVPGQGFTLALADADVNGSTRMCGKGGAWLGYAGSDAGVSPIKAPKIALEFDTQCSGTTFGETPCITPWQQMSFVHWGEDAGLNDDNKHGVGNNPPLGSPAENHALSLIGGQRHVRLEMDRTYDAGNGVSHHVMRAWLDNGFPHCPEFQDMSASLVTARASNPDCPLPTISAALDIPRSTSGGIPFKHAWLGFTTGQDGGSQTLFIHQFAAEVSTR